VCSGCTCRALVADSAMHRISKCSQCEEEWQHSRCPCQLQLYSDCWVTSCRICLTLRFAATTAGHHPEQHVLYAVSL
jgi:hypothetical protein